MRIVGGLDIHRAQITFDDVDVRTGEEVRGMIRPATRASFAPSEPPGPQESGVVLEATIGGGWWRRDSRRPAWRRIWPNQQTPEPCEDPSVGPRETAGPPAC